MSSSYTSNRASQTVKVANALGLHARPAAQIAREASRFDAEISLKYEEREANAKSIISLLTLGVPYDAVVEIHASGSDARNAADYLGNLLSSIFE